MKLRYVIDSVRRRSPIAVKIALQIAGRMGGKAGSPQSVGGLFNVMKGTSMLCLAWCIVE